MTDDKKIEMLLKSREGLKKRFKILEKSFEEEKENEDAWPGHDTNFLLQIQQDEQLIISLLADIEKNLKDLGYEQQLA